MYDLDWVNVKGIALFSKDIHYLQLEYQIQNLTSMN